MVEASGVYYEATICACFPGEGFFVGTEITAIFRQNAAVGTVAALGLLIDRLAEDQWGNIDNNGRTA